MYIMLRLTDSGGIGNESAPTRGFESTLDL